MNVAFKPVQFLLSGRELQSLASASSVWVTSVCVHVSSPQIECARIQDVGPRFIHLWTPCSTWHCLSQRKYMSDISWWIIPFFSYLYSQLCPIISNISTEVLEKTQTFAYCYACVLVAVKGEPRKANLNPALISRFYPLTPHGCGNYGSIISWSVWLP